MRTQRIVAKIRRNVASMEDRIAALLQSRYEVSACELAKISLQYCARLRALRIRGYVIANRVEMIEGKRHGFYRLIRMPGDQTPVQSTLFLTPPAHEECSTAELRRQRRQA